MKPLPARELAVPATALIGWAGIFVHNLAELPEQNLLSPESLIPLLVTALLWRRLVHAGTACGHESSSGW
ncbi:hypothetical protein [Pseudarthrobacter sp. NS4]|uniref:hypothetical protein n=1 Tax=Pseudarthrobacter sp. NS4 TaxID=2973976 RepID=UPI0021614CA5|nr:hypothetical protein [Pseudarthrobacter sp. NS4]